MTLDRTTTALRPASGSARTLPSWHATSCRSLPHDVSIATGPSIRHLSCLILVLALLAGCAAHSGHHTAALENPDPDVRRKAVAGSQDQAALARVALTDEDYQLRTAAVERITDQALLKDIVMDNGPVGVSDRALAAISDTTLLTSIAFECEGWNLRAAAAKRLTDEKVLTRIALGDSFPDVRGAAVRRLHDPSVLATVLARNEEWPFICDAAIERISDEATLAQVAIQCKELSVFRAALRKVNDPIQLERIVAEREDPRDRLAAVLRIRDPNVLRDIASGPVCGSCPWDTVRAAAAWRIADSTTALQVAMCSHDHDLLKIVFTKIKDRGSLGLLAGGAEDRAMRIASTQKAQIMTWKEIFKHATARGATVQMLGDAVAAVSLFFSEQGDAAESVRNACLALIRFGDKSRIPEMSELLRQYGNTTLAEDYLNSGQPLLERAGEEWASRNGYNITKSVLGSQRATWGSKR
jgi:hypothetical protein